MIHRGEIYYADLSPVVGSEQGGYRPVIVLQNNKGNRYSTTVIIAPISSRLTKNPLPTHVMVVHASGSVTGLRATVYCSYEPSSAVTLISTVIACVEPAHCI